MTDTGVDGEDTGWERTLAEMRDLAAERAAAGWDTATVSAGNTAPEPPGIGDSDRFGFVYTVPDDAAQAVESIVVDGDVDEYTVYRRAAGGRLFHVVELVDSAAETALFVAGTVELTRLDDLRSAARADGVVYTHLQLLDRTELGSIRHDDPAAFFPALA